MNGNWDVESICKGGKKICEKLFCCKHGLNINNEVEVFGNLIHYYVIVLFYFFIFHF